MIIFEKIIKTFWWHLKENAATKNVHECSNRLTRAA
jgi:hypothetical protein